MNFDVFGFVAILSFSFEKAQQLINFPQKNLLSARRINSQKKFCHRPIFFKHRAENKILLFSKKRRGIFILAHREILSIELKPKAGHIFYMNMQCVKRNLGFLLFSWQISPGQCGNHETIFA
jgi:hypothetical protein